MSFMKFTFLVIAIFFNFFNQSLIKSEEKIYSAKNKIENIAKKESITEEKTEIKKIHIVKSGDTISSISKLINQWSLVLNIFGNILKANLFTSLILIDSRSNMRGTSWFYMKLKNILKTTGALHILLGLLIIFLLIFSVETIAGKASTETLLLVRGTADVVAASNLGIGFLLIICSSIKDKKSLKKVLLGELVLMLCLLAVALFNTFNAGTIVDGGPPPPFWIVLIANPLLCIYGLIKDNK